MNNKTYNNWFVLQITTGKEYYIKDLIDKNTDEPIDSLIFSAKLLFKRNGVLKKVIRPLFPGYLFINRKVNIVMDLFQRKTITEFVKPICFRKKKCNECFIDSSPCMVFPQEMELLLSNSSDSGLFDISYGLKKGDKIKIIKGPLVNLMGNVLHINEKKKVVQVEIFLFNRRIKLYLGIDLINKGKIYQNGYTVPKKEYP